VLERLKNSNARYSFELGSGLGIGIISERLLENGRQTDGAFDAVAFGAEGFWAFYDVRVLTA
jgi:hypothetical protein